MEKNEAYFNIRDLIVNFKSFDGIKKAIDLEALSINKGETYGLVGESGAGKSVLAYSILRILSTPPAIIQGETVELDNENLLEKSNRQMNSIRGSKIALIFQDPMSSLNPVFTIGQQLHNVIRKNRQIPDKDINDEVLKMLSLVQLPDAEHIAKKYPHELSGGQRQRIIIALALSCDPQLLIADEPTRNLDVTIQAQILKLINKLQQQTKITVLYIANNPALISSFCNNMGIIHRGRLIESGKVIEVMRQPKHPYTSLLLHPTSEKEILEENSLTISSREDWSQLECCRFINECPHRLPECSGVKPRLKHIDGDHFVACYLH